LHKNEKTGYQSMIEIESVMLLHNVSFTFFVKIVII